MPKYDDETRERRRLYCKQYRIDHPEKDKLYRTRYAEKQRNDPSIKERRSAKFKERMESAEFRLHHAKRVHTFKVNNPLAALAINLRASAKRRAREYDVPFDLDLYKTEFFERVSKMTCELSGMELIAGRKRMQFNSVSVDRIKPELGYVYSNIRIIAFCLNTAFGWWGEEVTAVVMTAWLRDRSIGEANKILEEIGHQRTKPSPWFELLRKLANQHMVE